MNRGSIVITRSLCIFQLVCPRVLVKTVNIPGVPGLSPIVGKLPSSFRETRFPSERARNSRARRTIFRGGNVFVVRLPRGGTEKYFPGKISRASRGVRKGLGSSCLNVLRRTHAQVRGCTFPGVSADRFFCTNSETVVGFSVKILVKVSLRGREREKRDTCLVTSAPASHRE